MFDSLFNKYKVQYLKDYTQNLDGFLQQKKQILRKKIIRCLANRGLRCYLIDYGEFEIWSEEQKIVRMIFLNRHSKVDQDQYESLLKYFIEHFLLSFFHLKGPLLSVYDRKARTIRDEFMNIYWNEQNKVQDRMDSLIVVLIFQILYKERKFVEESFSSCFKFLEENKEEIED